MNSWDEVYQSIAELEEENRALREHVNKLIQKLRKLKYENHRLRKEKER